MIWTPPARGAGGVATGAIVAVSFGCAIVIAELSGPLFGPVPGAVLDTTLAAIMLIAFAWRPGAQGLGLLPVLALVALIRPISLVAAVPMLSPLSWYAIAGLTLFSGAAMAARLMDEPVRDLHLRIERPPIDALLGVVGVCAGLAGSRLPVPIPPSAGTGVAGVLVTAVVLGLFGGLLEELIFRGLLQSAATQALGSRVGGLAFAVAVSTALYSGSGSPAYTALSGLAGVAFGLALWRGASLWGIALGHALMLVTFALLLH